MRYSIRGRCPTKGGLLAATTVASLAFGCFASASAEDEFKIGLLAPFTGIASHYGPIYERSANVAVEKINAEGGILGRQIKLYIEDTKFSPAGAAEGAKKLVRRDRVVAVIGTVNSAATNAAIPVTERAKTPFVYTVEGEDKGCYKHVFGLGPTPEQKLGHWIPWFSGGGAKTFYFVGSDYVFPRSMAAFAKSVIAKQGGKVIGEEYSSLGTTDWSTILTRAEAAKPDVFFNMAVGGDSVSMSKQARQFGFSDKVKFAAIPGYNSAYMPGIHSIAQGEHGVEVYSEQLDNAANREFVKRHRAKYPSPWPITEVAASVYTAFHVVKAAAEKANGTDGPKIAAAIEGLTMDAPQGRITINAKTHLTDYHVYLLQIKGKTLNVVKDFGVTRAPQTCKPG